MAYTHVIGFEKDCPSGLSTMFGNWQSDKFLFLTSSFTLFGGKATKPVNMRAIAVLHPLNTNQEQAFKADPEFITLPTNESKACSISQLNAQ